jgi:hypothetical protein
MYVVGLNEALRTFSRLPAEADEECRKESGRIARWIATGAQMAARTTGYRVHRLAAVSLSVKATRAGRVDRIPTIILGDNRILPGRQGRRNTRRQRYKSIAAGAEFGGSRGSMAAMAGVPKGSSWRNPLTGRESVFKGTTSQFPPYLVNTGGRGGRGYFLYPTIRERAPEAYERWSDAVGRAIRRA